MTSVIRSSALIASLLLGLACQDPMGETEEMGRMGQMGGMEHSRMSGHEMAQAMQDPDTMREWMESMMGSPELMNEMMQRMHEDLRRRGEAGEEVSVYCPLMGFTTDNPPAPEEPYEAGSLSPQELFTRKCSRCHALPDPQQRTAAEWTEIVKRMQQYVEREDFTNLQPDEAASILRYLQTQAG